MTEGANGGVFHNRLAADRAAISVPGTQLARHDRGDLHGAAFSSALNAEVFVLAGTCTPVLDASLYDTSHTTSTATGSRSSLTRRGMLSAALAGGIDLLKVSDDQLRSDGYMSGEDRNDILRAIEDVRRAGAGNVVV
ncbi:MAG TPA: hypothetical protein VK923_16805 [Euzebyales bacterium]|nr:hypothetical protein [Euzebyales bacterium]